MDFIIEGKFSFNDDQAEIKTNCEYVYSKDLITISYNEVKDIGFNDIMTTLTVYPNNKVIISRHNNINANLIIEKDTRNTCYYYTPFTAFLMGITGILIKSDLSAEGGDLQFSYFIDSNGVKTSINKANITVKSKG